MENTKWVVYLRLIYVGLMFRGLVSKRIGPFLKIMNKILWFFGLVPFGEHERMKEVRDKEISDLKAQLDELSNDPGSFKSAQIRQKYGRPIFCKGPRCQNAKLMKESYAERH